MEVPLMYFLSLLPQKREKQCVRACACKSVHEGRRQSGRGGEGGFSFQSQQNNY